MLEDAGLDPTRFFLNVGGPSQDFADPSGIRLVRHDGKNSIVCIIRLDNVKSREKTWGCRILTRSTGKHSKPPEVREAWNKLISRYGANGQIPGTPRPTKHDLGHSNGPKLVPRSMEDGEEATTMSVRSDPRRPAVPEGTAELFMKTYASCNIQGRLLLGPEAVLGRASNLRLVGHDKERKLHFTVEAGSQNKQYNLTFEIAFRAATAEDAFNNFSCQELLSQKKPKEQIPLQPSEPTETPPSPQPRTKILTLCQPALPPRAKPKKRRKPARKANSQRQAPAPKRRRAVRTAQPDAKAVMREILDILLEHADPGSSISLSFDLNQKRSKRITLVIE